MTTGTGDADDPSLILSALYGVAPDEFTGARNDLVKRLRAAGRKDEATGVARMRKPPVTAWALNQLARQHPDVVAGLFDAGGGLRAAMDAALAGDPSAMRPARAAEREALSAALAAASRQLDGSGHPPTDAARRRIEATLRAAMVDEAVAIDLRRGTLDTDHDAPGFGFGDSTPGFPPDTEAHPARAAAKTVGKAGQDRAEKAAAEKASREQEEAARQAAAVRARLTETSERLAQRADELGRTAEEAEAAARTARQVAEAARAEADDARRVLEEADEAR